MKECFYGVATVFMLVACPTIITIAGYLSRIAHSLEKIASCFGG